MTSWGLGRWDVFLRDTGSQLRHAWYDGGASHWDPSWGAPSVGMSPADPSVIATGEGRLRIYVQGVDTNIYKRTGTSGIWGGC